MKIKKIVLVLCLLLISPLLMMGCGKAEEQADQGEPAAKTKAEILSTIADFINLDDINFTLEGDLEYDINSIDGNSSVKTSIAEGEIEGLVCKVTPNGLYTYMPYDYSRIQVGNTEMEKLYSEAQEATESTPAVAAKWNGWDIHTDYTEYEDEGFTDLLAAFDIEKYNPEIKAVFVELLLNMDEYVTTTELSNGAYKISINADLKNDLNFLLNTLVDNIDEPIVKTINSLLDHFVEEDLTVVGLFDEIKEVVTADTKVADFIKYVEEKFDIKISALFNLAEKVVKDVLPNKSIINQINFKEAKIFDLVNAITGETDQENMFNKTKFDALIDGLVAKLDNSEVADPEEPALTIGAVLEMVLEIEPEDLIDMLTAIKIDKAKININLTTTANNAAIEKIGGSIEVLADLYMPAEDPNAPATKVSTYDVAASFEFRFKDIGSTSVIIPTMGWKDIRELNLELPNIAQNELIANTDLVLTDIEALSFDFTFYNNLDERYEVSYDADNHTVTISKEYVNLILDDFINNEELVGDSKLFEAYRINGEDGLDYDLRLSFTVEKNA